MRSGKRPACVNTDEVIYAHSVTSNRSHILMRGQINDTLCKPNSSVIFSEVLTSFLFRKDGRQRGGAEPPAEVMGQAARSSQLQPFRAGGFLHPPTVHLGRCAHDAADLRDLLLSQHQDEEADALGECARRTTSGRKRSQIRPNHRKWMVPNILITPKQAFSANLPHHYFFQKTCAESRGRVKRHLGLYLSEQGSFAQGVFGGMRVVQPLNNKAPRKTNTQGCP